MAETLVTRIRNRVGTYSNSTQLLEWLEAGIRRVYENMPRLMVDRFASGYSVSSGLTLTKYLVKSFSYNGPGRFITLDNKYLVSNGSIHQGSEFSPVGWFEAEKFYTYPTGCTAQALKIDTLVSSATSITRFPYEYEEIPILYASIQAIQAKINSLLEDTVGVIAWSDQTAPTAPSAPSFTYTDAMTGLITSPTIAYTDSIAYVSPDITLDYTSINSAISDEDEELTRAAGEKLQIKLEEIQKNLLDSLNLFNETVERNKNSLQQAITQAQLTLQESIATASDTKDVNLANEAQELARQVQQYQASLVKYQNEISSYAADINQEGTRISALLNSYGVRLQGMIQQVTILKQEFAELMQELRNG